MGALRTLCARGDSKIEWDVWKKETVREAERIFRENAAKGYASFRVNGGLSTAERIDDFDPEAKEIVQIPHLAGG